MTTNNGHLNGTHDRGSVQNTDSISESGISKETTMGNERTRNPSIKERILEEKELVIAGLSAKRLLVSNGEEREPKLIYFRPPFEAMEIDGRPNMMFHTDLDSVDPDSMGIKMTREVAEKTCEEAFVKYWKPSNAA